MRLVGIALNLASPRGAIARGVPHGRTGLRIATIKDVAAKAGVSVKTVSRVINREASVQPSTRQRVEAAIEALRYRPDVSARSLRGMRSYAMGVVYDNPNPYYVIAIQNGLLAVCREFGYALQIHPCDSSSPTLAEELLQIVRQNRLAGLVLAPPMSEREPLIRFLAESKVPFVRLISGSSDPQDGYLSVYVDDRSAAREITTHLIQLGHQRIGFIWGGQQHRSSPERYQGYEEALHDYGVALDPELVVQGDYSFDEGFRAARRLLALPNPPTAIFGSNDEIAAGVLAAARSIGVNVPFDLSIAGFEDSPFSKQSWPALTTARQDTQDIARTAGRMLIEEVDREEGSPPPRNCGFVPRLVARGSTTPVRPGRES